MDKIIPRSIMKKMSKNTTSPKKNLCYFVEFMQNFYNLQLVCNYYIQ